MRLHWSGLFGFALLSGFLLVTVPAARAAGDENILKKMDEAKLTLSKAIEAAESQSRGNAVSAHAKLDGKVLLIMVRSLVGNKCMECIVDAAGKVTMEEAKGRDPKDDIHARAAAAVQMMEGAKMPLTKAIEAVETHTKGKAVAARCEAESFEVSCVVESRTMKYTVDKTGKVAEKKADPKKEAPKKP